jgi:hypothetical protein
MIASEILASIDTRAKSALSGLVDADSIGNYLPQGTKYPHVLYQIDFETLRVKGEDSQEVTLQFDIWTRYRGSKEALDIADAIRSNFDGSPLLIASADGFGCTYDSMDNFVEPEGTVYRCTMLFTLLYGDS